MSAGTLPHVPGLQDVLRHCRRRVLRQTAIRGLASIVSTALLVVLVACLLDYLIALPGWIRLGLLTTAVAATGWAAWRWLVQPLLHAASGQELGAAVDLAFPDLHEAVATLLAVESPEATASEAGSAAMRHRLQQQVAVGLRQVRVQQVVSPRVTRLHCGVALCLLGIFALPVCFWPSGSQQLLHRLAVPWANLGSVTNLWFEVPDPERWVAADSDVQLVAIPRWRTRQPGQLPQQVHLEVQTDDGQSDSLPMSYEETAARYTVQLPRVHHSLNYRVAGGGATTEWFRLQVATPPQISAARLTATPPTYTGRPVEIFDGVVGALEVFERSHLEIRLAFNKPVERAEIHWLDWTPITSEQAVDELPEGGAGRQDTGPATDAAGSDSSPKILVADQLAEDRLSAVFRLSALGGGRFRFHLRDDVQLTNPAEPERQLVVVEDAPPELRVSGLHDDLELQPGDVLPLDCSVRDDIGIGQLELHYHKNADADRIVAATDLPRGSAAAEHAFRLALADLDVQPGDLVSVRVRATDERPVPEPHVVWQGPWNIRISATANAIGREALSAADQQLLDSLRQLEEQLRQDAERGNELKNALWKQWDEPTQTDVRQLSEKEQLQGRQLQQLADQVGQHPLMQRQADSLQQLGSTVRETVAARLNEAVQQERNGAAARIQDSVRDLQRARDQLHKTIEEIERLATLEQELAELNRLALEAEQLAEQAECLQQLEQQQPEEGQSPEERQAALQQQREQLEGDRQQLSDQLAGLLQRREELLESARRSQLDQLADLATQARQLAQQEQQIAEGVREEARDASRAAQPLTQQLQEVRNETQQLNRRLDREAAAVAQPDTGRLDDALQALRDGNLSQAQQSVATATQQLQQAAAALRQPAEQPAATPAENSSASAPAAPSATADSAATPAQQQLREAATGLAERLQTVEEALQQLQTERQSQPPQTEAPAGSLASASTEPNDQPGNQQGNQSGNQPGSQPGSQPAGQPASSPDGQQGGQPDSAASTRNVAENLLQRLRQLSAASAAMAAELSAPGSSSREAARSAAQASQHAQEAERSAAAGQFARAAQRMRQSAMAGEESAGRVAEAEPDRRQQLQTTSREMSQLADTLEQLQQDNSAQLAAQQQAQSGVNQQAQGLPQQLSSLSERLQLPAIGLPQQGTQAAEASVAATEAAQSGQQAAQQLQQTNLQAASNAAQSAAAAMNRAAQLSQQGSATDRSREPLVPSDVGSSVAQALQSLNRARQTPQSPGGSQNAESGSESDSAAAETPDAPGDSTATNTSATADGPSGQAGAENAADMPAGPEAAAAGNTSPAGNSPAEGADRSSVQQPASDATASGTAGQTAEQLSAAAQALAQAARGALPQQFTPGQMSDAQGAAGSSSQGTGNDQGWDGQQAGRGSQLPARLRQWGRLQDTLDGELSDAGRDTVDQEYADLIRRYREALARAAAGQTTEPPAADAAATGKGQNP